MLEPKPSLINKAEALTEEEALEIATEAYIYGYSYITSEMTRRIQTNVVEPEGTRAPMGQFINLTKYPTAAFRDITAPNADTLYSLAWVDLGQEAWVFSYPNLNGRYALFPMYSLWTDVIDSPGSRTTTEASQTFLLTRPHWKGNIPTGMKQVKSPTRYMVILGRTYCLGTPEDYEKVGALQAQYKLQPLSTWGKTYRPPVGTVNPNIDMKTATRDQVNALSAQAYFKMMTDLMKDNPPLPQDEAILAKMAKVGIVPGQDFDLSKLSPAVVKGIERAPKIAIEKIAGHFNDSGKEVNGWEYALETGKYGTDYLQRAFIAAFGWGANLPQDAVYPYTQVDDSGQKLNGSHQYIIRFPKGQTPPVKGFWSITMYDPGFFFIANPLNKYTVSPRNALKYNPDGSLDIYIQNESPGKDKEANWLPAPKGDFLLMLRMYWPQETNPSILNGTWNPSVVQRVN